MSNRKHPPIPVIHLFAGPGGLGEGFTAFRGNGSHSRRNPQYDQNALKRLLAKDGIEYFHLAGLGGLRHARKGSLNTAWKNASFHGYADYMQTPEFARAVEELIATASIKKTALLCAEAVPWRCHRSLVRDALPARC